MARKQGLKPDEHASLGSDLFALRNRLLDRYVQVANAYPKNSRPARELRKALTAIDEARGALDSELGWEHPAEFDAFTYYPAGRKETT